jgi:hypothetical protein
MAEPLCLSHPNNSPDPVALSAPIAPPRRRWFGTRFELRPSNTPPEKRIRIGDTYQSTVWTRPHRQNTEIAMIFRARRMPMAAR